MQNTSKINIITAMHYYDTLVVYKIVKNIITLQETNKERKEGIRELMTF